MPPSLEAFGWQAARKRLRSAPELREELGKAFRREEELEDEVMEETPALLSLSARRLSLEDAETKRKRLTAEGAILAQSGRFAEAQIHWEQALAFTDDQCQRAPILEQMAQVLLLQERHFDAIRVAARAVECRPLWHCSHLTLGRALLAFGEIERAVESFRRSFDLASQACLDAATSSSSAPVQDQEEARLELCEAERLLAEARKRSDTVQGKEVVINGRVLESRFWETALRVTYDEHGMPTTHFPEEPGGT